MLRLGPVAPLEQGLALLPLTDALLGSFQPPGRILPALIEPLPVVAPLLAEWSSSGPVAYVEVSSAGSQLAVVWADGARVLGPLLLDSGLPAAPSPGSTDISGTPATPAAGSIPGGGAAPIARALRRLGASAAGHPDECDAVGLGRHLHFASH